ncbi:hypothetical protein L917_09842 [Phytophthora nicotianae]|uniref:Uncharacterized protein n=1 Tax=Phytophthora nicotianae TaxID=4792 RepID=W2L4T4_PHYNI|nr:hypothetical protein L917_09842 [Phytophthora nicotianae]
MCCFSTELMSWAVCSVYKTGVNVLHSRGHTGDCRWSLPVEGQAQWLGKKKKSSPVLLGKASEAERPEKKCEDGSKTTGIMFAAGVMQHGLGNRPRKSLQCHHELSHLPRKTFAADGSKSWMQNPASIATVLQSTPSSDPLKFFRR